MWLDKLLSMGKDYCDYFEHVLMSLGIKTGHSSIGCKFCKENTK